MLSKNPFGDLAVVTVGMMTILFIWYCTVDDDVTTPYTTLRSSPAYMTSYMTHSLHNPGESQGHIFVYSSYEEQTNGARNLWQLEIWAKLMEMKVAEPFAVDSMFGVMGATPNFNKSLRFSNYYDIQKWNNMVAKYDGSPLIRWEKFLIKAPHQAIILYTIIREIKRPLTISTGVDDIKTYDPVLYEQIADSDLIWLKSIFNISRVVTLVRSSLIHQPLTLEEYRSYVFGSLNPSKVTLIIVNWIGIGVWKHRIEIKSAPSSFNNAVRVNFKFSVPGYSVSPELLPSPDIIKAYNTYVSKYIGDRKYVGVVFRTHSLLYYCPRYSNFDGQRRQLQTCSKTLSHELDKIRNKWGIFLAYDLGMFGSVGYYNSFSDKRLIPLHFEIFGDVFKGKLFIKEREKMLITAAGGITDRGFIAQLEKTIATHADCIILLGRFSSFVESCATEYISLHDTNRCIVSICSEDVLDSSGKVISSHSIT